LGAVDAADQTGSADGPNKTAAALRMRACRVKEKV
jgi:hypothetical protein